VKWIAVTFVSALLLCGCGGNTDEGSRLVVSAASSLTEALTACSRDFPDADVRLQFAGSDELTAQIHRGVSPDVFAAANTKLPGELQRDGLLEEPVVFATNELVLAAPAGSSRVRSLDDVADPDVKLAIGSESVPIGSYTREVLSRLHASQSQEILENVRSEEPDVKGVVGKLTQRAVDAGFVYASDVAATRGELTAIRLSPRLRPTVEYGAGVVADSDRADTAQRYVRELVSGKCADALRQAGFGPPP
jgi:molybdate transport system substrate-binding protein